MSTDTHTATEVVGIDGYLANNERRDDYGNRSTDAPYRTDSFRDRYDEQHTNQEAGTYQGSSGFLLELPY